MITNIKNQYINLLFKSPQLAYHVAKPLMQFMTTLFTNPKYKLSLLVGHDSNIAALLAVLGIKEYQLPEQYELTPIGGKVVFSRLYDKKNQQHYFKAEYVYQTFEQIHLGTPISLTNPPKHITLTLTDSEYCGNGLYLWQDVKNRLDNYLASS